jgi:hypothetical protein
VSPSKQKLCTRCSDHIFADLAEFNAHEFGADVELCEESKDDDALSFCQSIVDTTDWCREEVLMHGSLRILAPQHKENAIKN